MFMSETQEQQRRETNRQRHKMEWRKWKENGMRKLMIVGEKCHATWKVMCYKMSVWVAT